MRWLAVALMLMVLTAGATAADIPAEGPVFAGISLPDHLGAAHDLAAEAPSALVMLFRVDDRVSAKEWDDGLRLRLAGHRLVPVIDASDIAPGDRPKLIEKATAKAEGKVLFLLDWDGEVRKRVRAHGLDPGARGVVIAGVRADGALAGTLAGEPDAANRTKALGWLGIVPKPPLIDAGDGP
ncbi:MAG: hypothetical protein H0W83_17235 [Planctomycetes bacterium]|nr:hypothetical protein [Planctomycetota bacterium]